MKTITFVNFLILKHFSWQQYIQLRDTPDWPLTNSESSAMWKAVHADIAEYIARYGAGGGDEDEDGDADDGEDVEMPFTLEDASWKETARRWLRQAVRLGHVDWQQTNVPGSKMEKLQPVLDEMHDILITGIPLPPDDEGGQGLLLFEETVDAAMLVPRFATLMEEYKLKNHCILWRMLQAKFPKLRKTTQPIKRPRNYPVVKVLPRSCSCSCSCSYSCSCLVCQ